MIKNQVFIIGAQRCGTTFLYKLLDAHPQIELAKPIRPEPKFFLTRSEYDKGLAHYQNKYFNSLNKSINTIGEKGTSYIEYPEVAERIKQFYPNAKIIILLRNPVDRALSNYFFTKDNNLENRSLEDVFLNKKPFPKFNKSTSVNPFSYLKRGRYIEYIKPFFKHFSNNLKIVLFEDLIKDKKNIEEIYNFIGVDNTFMPDDIKQTNSSQSKNEQTINPIIIELLKNYYQPLNKKLELFLGHKTNW